MDDTVQKRRIKRGSRYCCACPTVRYNSPDIHLFRFPRDKQQCQKWVDFLGIPMLQESSYDELNRYFRLCNLHFEPKAFRNSLRKSLNYQAMPTLIGRNGWANPPPTCQLENSTLTLHQETSVSSSNVTVPLASGSQKQNVSVPTSSILDVSQISQQLQAVPPAAPKIPKPRIATITSSSQSHFPPCSDLTANPMMAVQAQYGRAVNKQKPTGSSNSQLTATYSEHSSFGGTRVHLKPRFCDDCTATAPSKICKSSQESKNTNARETVVNSEENSLIVLPTLIDVKTEIFDENVENEFPSNFTSVESTMSYQSIDSNSQREKDKLLLYRKLCSTPLKLPSTMWTTVCHPKREYFIICQVGFVCGFTVQKGIRFTAKMCPPDIHIRNTKVKLPDFENVCSVEDVERLVHELDKVTLCPGTGLRDVGYSKVCCGTARMSVSGQLMACNACSMLKVVLLKEGNIVSS